MYDVNDVEQMRCGKKSFAWVQLCGLSWPIKIRGRIQVQWTKLFEMIDM